MCGNEHQGVEYASFTVDIKRRCFHSCDSVGYRLRENFPLMFFHVDFVFGQLKTRHLVLVYCTKLFGYRNITLCPVCVLAFVTAY